MAVGVQPLVNPRLDELEAGSVSAKLAGSRQRAAAALLRSRSAQARTSALEMQVEQLVMQSQTKTAVLKDMHSQATSQSEKAEIYSQAAVKASESMKAKAKGLPAQAEGLAVAAVQKMLESGFNDLQDWRDDVLRDPNEKTKDMAAKAAAPYRKMKTVLLRRMQAYAAQASTMAEQANEAKAKAVDIVMGAQQKQDAGDARGALEDMESARAMAGQASQLSESARALQASAEQMNRQSALYTSAENAAVARAQYDANPNSMPPLLVDPQTAYTPQPPAAL